MAATCTKIKRGLLEAHLVGSKYAVDSHSMMMSWKFWSSHSDDCEEQCLWNVTSRSLEDINILVEYAASIIRVEQ
jgi:hypothetical protein